MNKKGERCNGRLRARGLGGKIRVDPRERGGGKEGTALTPPQSVTEEKAYGCWYIVTNKLGRRELN